ncbi:hypothetical protein L602_000500000380 [Cupriavidus gilardii J11]|uniref:Uncharacterized protein n=1 Tax=Cupriavidus gilardii J11 TaxID=936133 RepID=A0A562B5E5_9BURK|nr:hypothetical protein [Cupriavidus gilardii]TWG80392.1 hypothetical protein L602_000500000380 [Cupriavidus gilardii J11]
MAKREGTRRALQDELSRRIQRIDEIVEDGVRVRVPPPQPHPRDARGRNWDVKGFTHVKGYERQIRAVVDKVRDEYDLVEVSASDNPFSPGA